MCVQYACIRVYVCFSMSMYVCMLVEFAILVDKKAINKYNIIYIVYIVFT